MDCFTILPLEKLLRYANVASRHVLLGNTWEISERTYNKYTYKVKHTGFLTRDLLAFQQTKLIFQDFDLENNIWVKVNCAFSTKWLFDLKSALDPRDL